MLERGSAEKGLFGGLVTGECVPSPVCLKDWWNLKPASSVRDCKASVQTGVPGVIGVRLTSFWVASLIHPLVPSLPMPANATSCLATGARPAPLAHDGIFGLSMRQALDAVMGGWVGSLLVGWFVGWLVGWLVGWFGGEAVLLVTLTCLAVVS